ncbi:hypothetical protein LCGC14_0838410, partial [marine sediment metagenome]
MWYILNIIIIIICIITRVYCITVTLKALKYPDYFYEGNPIMKKIFSWKYGKILGIIFSFLYLIMIFVFNFILQKISPGLIWIFTISTLVLLVICIYDFINNIYLFRYYKEV